MHHMKSRQSSADSVLTRIADYVIGYKITRKPAYDIAHYCLLDSLACLFHALPSRECAKLLGPVVPGTKVPNGARVPGTRFELDPIKAAFDIGTAIRWLDYNDSWFAAEGGHPSDNLGAIIAVADFVGRGGGRGAGKGHVLKVKDVLTALIKAYEIQGVLQLKNSLVNVGLDSSLLVNVASAAVATHMLGGTRAEIINALSNAWLDGGGPRLYRIGHHVGWRKAWSEGDMTRRGVMHAWWALSGEMGYPAALTAPDWGFNDVTMRGKPIVLARPLDSYVVENILWKIPYPAQFHPQTASECACRLHPLVKDRIGEIKAVHLRTHGRTLETSDKQGPLGNPAERDHCIQYIVAVSLLNGKIRAEDYEDEAAADPRVDKLRARMTLREDQGFTRGFRDPRRRSNANAVRVEFRDGTSTPDICIEYPVGHPRRRQEGIALVEKKFRQGLQLVFSPRRQQQILDCCGDPARFSAMPFAKFMDMLAK